MKKWCIQFLCFYLFFLIIGGGIILIVDPYFHFHKPLKNLSYRIWNERYVNNGIIRHFDYNAVIVGSSMTENFKTTEFDGLFHVKSIKIPYSGASYLEVNEALEQCYDNNDNLDLVVRCLDYDSFYEKADSMHYKDYPTYLYDDNIFNDVNYLFNKEIIFDEVIPNVMEYSLLGGSTTSLDEYRNWNDGVTFGRENVLKKYQRPSTKNLDMYSDDLDGENIKYNVLQVIEKHPETQFYLFWPPYSIVYYDSIYCSGMMETNLRWEKQALELLLPYENVHFYSFRDSFDIITNLDNYTDFQHYNENINSYMLRCMKNGDHEVTEDNFEEYCERVYEFYTTYNYNKIFE